MKKQSAGILIYRFNKRQLQVFLVHPGGPFWKNKDAGAWSIPKGEYSEDEEPLKAAIREVKEETGFEVDGKFISLEPISQKGGKRVLAWAIEADPEPQKITSNTFEMEWPPSSGRRQIFPEVDRASWFTVEEALEKINPAQAAFIRELAARVGH